MKMARASEQDLEAALTVSRIIEELEKGYMPGDDNAEETEFFDQDNPEHCKRALDAILSATHQGSIFRVTFGMAVVLDPRNKLLDPDADTLELHPDLVRKAASVAAPAAGDARDAERYRSMRNLARLPAADGHAVAQAALKAAGLDDVYTPDPDQFDKFVDNIPGVLAASQQQEG